ncbi:MAG TPA: heparinase II/III family protein [Gemmatimonadaceae bacterium]|nr:heparinase II/III family protein [Gemmatimonadaceae bacterium]
MSLLLDAAGLAARRATCAGALKPLADSLAADLEPVLAADIHVPTEKALLSRAGGRCARDGATLTFDPWSPRAHRCPSCGAVYHGELHDRWWLYPYQLWLAERVVHASTLFALRGDHRDAGFARRILLEYADAYLQYPNRDNVLGPTRPFFSTYLESIWTLQLCVAADLLCHAGEAGVVDIVRDRIVEPSVALIASYEEGGSNRQVWNDAAMLAAYRLLGRHDDARRVVQAPSGVIAHLERGLLPDGTWFEGENYHQFAHRGLWYCMQFAQALDAHIPPDLVARFDEGFAATFATALPDLTLPSRKDSQYGVSLRQWRFAEVCELGLARRDDPRLSAVLGRLYDGTVPGGDTGRRTSSAEAERQSPPVQLSRADLGWKSLLFAREVLPPAGTARWPSVALEGQGIAVIRRDAGQVYVALDYGQSGGGHGHPDRLNLLFSHGATRWLDDLGTGSYVDRSLHWYRSTLAHNAPLVDGASQWRVDGVLDAFDDRGAAGWVRASAEVAPGVEVTRTLVVMPGYFLDEVRWQADRDIRFVMPFRLDAQLTGGAPVRAAYTGQHGLEDGTDFVTTLDAWRVGAGGAIELTPAANALRVSATCSSDAVWYRLSGPGQPATEQRPFLAAECHARQGVLRSVWAWSRDVRAVHWTHDTVSVEAGHGERHAHSAAPHGWHIELHSGAAHSSIDLEGLRPHAGASASTPAAGTSPAEPGHLHPTRVAPRWFSDATEIERGAFLVRELGRQQYRRSEDSWHDAGAPVARVALAASSRAIIVDVHVTTPHLRFLPADAENPWDNEHADVNTDGVELFFRGWEAAGAWMLTLDPEAGEPHVRPIDGWHGARLAHAAWRRCPDGYELRAEIELPPGLRGRGQVALDVLVNLTQAGRERRSGQLVMSGAHGEWVYLRGDRHDPSRLLPLIIEP